MRVKSFQVLMKPDELKVFRLTSAHLPPTLSCFSSAVTFMCLMKPCKASPSDCEARQSQTFLTDPLRPDWEVFIVFAESLRPEDFMSRQQIYTGN